MKCRYLTLAGLLASAAIASAAPAAATSAPKETNFLEVLLKGGLMMYPLGVLSLITVLLIFVFMLSIRRNAIVSDRFMNNAEALIRKRDYAGLITYCHRRNECMARITQKTLDYYTANPGTTFDSVRDVAQVEGSHQAGLLTARITYLADIGGIAPMIGLLGTVIGMIKAFMNISSGAIQGVRELNMAQGVSEALIATAGGLAISIPALTFYAIFRGRVQRYVAELEAATTHFIGLLQTQIDRQPTAPAYQPPAVHHRAREDHAVPVPSPLVGERPDLHGI